MKKEWMTLLTLFSVWILFHGANAWAADPIRVQRATPVLDNTLKPVPITTQPAKPIGELAAPTKTSISAPVVMDKSPGELRIRVPYSYGGECGNNRAAMVVNVIGPIPSTNWSSNRQGDNVAGQAEFLIQYRGRPSVQTTSLQITIRCNLPPVGGQNQGAGDSPGSPPPGVPNLGPQPGLVVQVLTKSFPLSHNWSNEDLDLDNIADWKEQALLVKFAPEVRLHPADWTRPSSVEWWLGRTKMGFNHPTCPDCEILARGGPSQSNIATKGHRPKSNWPECSHTGERHSVLSNSSTDFYLNAPCSGRDSTKPIHTAPGADDVHRGDGSGGSWTTYGHVFSPAGSPANYFIQYWFFYPYNDFKGVSGHEGDWEHVTVVVEKSREIAVSMYFSQHLGGRLLPVNPSPESGERVTFVDGTHPVVYSAIGSHACYPRAGQWDVAFPFPPMDLPLEQALHDALLHDHTGDGGPRWQTWERPLVNIGEKDHPMNNQTFTFYGGRWGDIGTNLGKASPSWTLGPVGPTFHSTKWVGDVLAGWNGY